jgi:hypothetical protein
MQIDFTELTTDELFLIMPSFVNVCGDLYHFNLIKGNKRFIISYEQNQSEGGRILNNTRRSDKKIKKALLSMLYFLLEFNYLGEIQINKIYQSLK